LEEGKTMVMFLNENDSLHKEELKEHVELAVFNPKIIECRCSRITMDFSEGSEDSLKFLKLVI